MSTRVPVEIEDDILERIVASAQIDRRSVDAWIVQAQVVGVRELRDQIEGHSA